MSQLLITTDEHDFIVFDLNTNTVTHKQDKTEELHAHNLANRGRPVFRPFGVDYDNEFIYIASNDKFGKFNRSDYTFNSLIDIPLYINTHQIVKDKDTLFVCNTAVDCIGIYDLKNNTNKQFNVNLLNVHHIKHVPDNADQLDSRHLNSLLSVNDKVLFCRHNRGIPNSDFGILDKNTLKAEIIVRAGKSCHGIRLIENYMYSLSSNTGEILEINLETKEVSSYPIVDPKVTFLRGLEIIGNKIIIGCSVNFKSNTDQSSHLMILDLDSNTLNKFQLDDIKFINDLRRFK